jgi:uncharacterized membrane protein HdeD (DUF308 family)
MSQQIGEMTDKAKSTLRESAPWNPDAPWWMLLIEGIVSLVIGGYLFNQTTEALALTGRLIALFLLITGLWHTLTGLGGKRRGIVANMDFARGVIGLVVGVLVFGLSILGVLTPEAGGYILAFGMLLYGLLGVAVGLGSRRRGRIRWGLVLVNVLFVALSAMIFWGYTERISSRIGGFLVVFGVFLIGYAVYTAWSSRRQQPEPAAVQPAQAPPNQPAAGSGPGQAP